MQLAIGSNAAELGRALKSLEREQIPFAMAKALTNTAQDARESARANVRGRLTLRNKYSERGVRINAARKSDWPKIQAGVGIDKARAYLIDHEMGEFRKGSAGHRRAVPTRLVRRTAGGKIRKSQTPRALRERRGKTKTGRKSAKGGATVLKGTNRLVVRKGRGKRARLWTFYHLVEGVRIRRVLDVRGAIQRRAARSMPGHFKREFAAALRTAKPRGGGQASGHPAAAAAVGRLLR